MDRVLSMVATVLLAGCGGVASAYYGPETAADTSASGGSGGGHADADAFEDHDAVMIEAVAPPASEPLESDRTGVGWEAFDNERVEGEASRRQLLVQAPRRREPQPPEPTPQQPPPEQDPDQQPTGTNATGGPLLIHQAGLNLTVYHVREDQRSVIQVADQLGGCLSRQDDQVVVIGAPRMASLLGCDHQSPRTHPATWSATVRSGSRPAASSEPILARRHVGLGWPLAWTTTQCRTGRKDKT